jgi:methyl-accepting chemotaxis protein
MLMVRMNVKDFIITGSDKDHKEYLGYMKKMGQFLAEAKKQIKDPKRAADIQKEADARGALREIALIN